MRGQARWTSPHSPLNTKVVGDAGWAVVVALFDADPRWQALGDELEREELFEEYALSLERKEATERRAKRKERLEAFRQLLADTPAVRFDSQWRRVQALLEGHDAFRALDKIDRAPLRASRPLRV